MKSVIKQSLDTAGKRVLMATDYYTPAQLMSELGKTLGVKAEAVKIPEETYKSSLSPQMAQEMLENMLLMEIGGYYGGENLGPSHALLQEKPVQWEDFVKRNSSKFVQT